MCLLKVSFKNYSSVSPQIQFAFYLIVFLKCRCAPLNNLLEKLFHMVNSVTYMNVGTSLEKAIKRVNWRINKLLLPHNFYSHAKRIPLFHKRPLQFDHCYWEPLSSRSDKYIIFSFLLLTPPLGVDYPKKGNPLWNYFF